MTRGVGVLEEEHGLGSHDNDFQGAEFAHNLVEDLVGVTHAGLEGVELVCVAAQTVDGVVERLFEDQLEVRGGLVENLGTSVVEAVLLCDVLEHFLKVRVALRVVDLLLRLCSAR